MSSLQISFSPVEFGFLWHSKECNCHSSGSGRFYTIHDNKSVYMTEHYDINREKVYTIIRDAEIIYCGKIDTKYFAQQLLKNLGIK